MSFHFVLDDRQRCCGAEEGYRAIKYLTFTRFEWFNDIIASTSMVKAEGGEKVFSFSVRRLKRIKKFSRLLRVVKSRKSSTQNQLIILQSRDSSAIAFTNFVFTEA